MTKKSVTLVIDDAYENIIGSFVQEARPMLESNLDRQSYNVTGNLKNSLDISFHKKGHGWIITLSMLFYGKVLEKKETFAFSASVQDLAQWIKQRGIGNFSYVPGYPGRSIDSDKAAERIAWAIKMSDNRYRFGNPGTATSTYSAGRRTSTKQNAINISWLYRPYFGLWAKKRSEFLEVFYGTTSEELIDEVVKINRMSVQALAPQPPNIVDTFRSEGLI